MAYVPLSKSAPRVGGYVPLSKSPAPAVSTAPGLQGETATSLLGSSAVVAKPSTQAIPDSTTGRGLGGFLKDLAQGTLRDFVAAGIAVGNDIKKSTIGGTLDPKALGILGPTLLGSEPVRGLTDTAADYQRSLEQTPLKKGATPLAILGSVAPTALDFLGLGGETKGATALFKALKATDATAEGEAKAFGILRGAGFSEDVANQYAKVVADSKDLDAIKTAIMAAKKLQETTIEAGAKSTTRAYVPLAEQAKSVAEKIPGVQVAADTAETAPAFSKEVEPLAREAEKYATAADFKAKIEDVVARYKSGAALLDSQKALVEALKAPELKGTKLTDFYTKVKGESLAKPVAARVNTKLEKMAASSPTFGEFYSKSGITLEALNATARNKGYATAAEFYAKNAARPAATAVADDAEMASLERVAQMQGTYENLPELPRRSPTSLGEETAAAKQALEDARVQRDVGRGTVPDMPGADLAPYESRAFPGELPEVKPRSKTVGKDGQLIKDTRGKFAARGDVIAKELGFEDVEAAQEALTEYKKARQQLKAAEASVSARVKNYRDRKAVFDEVVRYVKQEGQARRDKIKLVQDFFKLTDGEVKTLLKGERDVRLMNDGEFDDFLKRFEGKSTEVYLRMQDLVDLKSTIFDKEFVKLDNLRQAMKLPQIENMTPEQMRMFNETLQQFETGDEFLGVRQLETLRHTDIDGIKTIREAREKLLANINESRARKGLPLATMEDLSQVKVGTKDPFISDVALARQNPLYEVMVHETHKAMLTADAAMYDVKDKANELFAAARKSRPQTLLGRLIPTDEYIFKWLEAPDAQKLILGEDMTHEELEAAMYVRAWYAEARDYLVQEGVLKRYRTDYVTHIRRGFLEAWYDEGKNFRPDVSGASKPGTLDKTWAGLKGAFKEVLDAYKQDAEIFNILDSKTGDVLPLEKFFQFSMHRTGNLVPTQNVARAFVRYASTFEKKKMLDSIVPKLDVFVHSLTPKKLTPRGLEFDDSIKRFFKEWMNNKKGRVSTQLWIKPGGKIDWALRTGMALTRILDLGLNLTVGVASHGGAQMAAYTGLGEKAYAEGVSRLTSAQGKKIAEKYRNLVGESLLKKVRAADSTLGENLVAGTMGIFAQADRKSREVYLLGSMTPGEFAAGEVSANRLTDIALALGRRMPLEGTTSMFGRTAPGKLATQYKTWAVPLLESAADSLAKLSTAAKDGKLSEYVRTPEGAELLRTAILTSVVGIGGYSILSDKTPLSQMSATERLTYKAAQDALSGVGAIDPRLWLAQPRLEQFLQNLGKGVVQLLFLNKNAQGELSGVKTLKTTLTPGLVRQVIPPTTESASAGGLPSLPKLPKIGGGLPKLPKIGH